MPSLIEAVERANSVILRAFQVFLGGNQHVLAENGNTPFTKITRKVIVAGRDRRSKRPASARHFLDAMKGLFASAVEAEHVTVNPTVGIQSPKKSKGDGFPAWTAVDIAAFEKRWPIGARERLAFDVLRYTGLRRGDAVKLGRPHVRDGVISIRTEKTGEWIAIVDCSEFSGGYYC